MATIKTPKVGDQFIIGQAISSIYVYDVEEPYEEFGQTIVYGHDDNGDEVEVRFNARQPEDGWYDPEEDDE